MSDWTLQHRAAIHRALGDPLRLAIVDALLLGDLAPSELEERLGVASNLLAHHLAALEGAGVVERMRSSGDGRRRYLRLRPEATALAHPPPARGAARVLFVCTGNSARSPMAEALWSEASEVPAASAGTRPASSTHPLAIDAVRKAGLHATQSPQAVANTLQPGDLVVTVCDQAHEGWGEAGTPARPDLHWSIPDPAASASPAAFAQALALLRQRVAALVPYVRPMGMEQAQ